MLAVVKVREVAGSTVITIPSFMREELGWEKGYQVVLKSEEVKGRGLGRLIVEVAAYVDMSEEDGPLKNAGLPG